MKHQDDVLMRLLVRIGLRGILKRLIEMRGESEVRAALATLTAEQDRQQ
jgi:hypothetical protein